MSCNVLAVNPGHNGSVCLIIDGKIDFYIEEERLSRMKYDGNPFRGILLALQRCEIHHLVIGGTTTEYDKLPWTREDSYYSLVRKFYPKVNVVYIGECHHLGHACSAYYNSGFDQCASIVVDGAGSFSTVTSPLTNNLHQGFEVESIFKCSGPSTIEKVYGVYGGANKISENIYSQMGSGIEVVKGEQTSIFHDCAGITKVYEAVTEYLGFGFIEAGKTMGLAPYGKSDPTLSSFFSKQKGDRNNIIPFYPAGAYLDSFNNEQYKISVNKREWHTDSSLLTEKQKNIAWLVQEETQKLVGDLIQKAVDITGFKKIAISGGYGLNCVANYYYKNRFPDLEIFVDPVSHDGGTTIGLAKLFSNIHNLQHNGSYGKIENVFGKKNKFLDTLYLGPNRIEELKNLKPNKKYDLVDVNVEHVSDLLLQGEIVSIFQSKSEAGPRALGNRSILFDPRITDGKQIVNKIKGREWFRPFAGTVLVEFANEWFEMLDMDSSPFMMYAVKVKSEKIKEIPSIVHVDNSCRIQTISEEQNVHFYNLIKRFYEKTKVPILFNTSFNLAGDPLVETIADVYDMMDRSELKYVYLPEVQKMIIKTKPTIT